MHHVVDGEDVTVTDVTEDRGILAVAGPKSREILAGLTDADLTNESFQAAAADLGEVELTGALAASVGPGKYSADDSPLVRLEWDSAAQDFIIPS